MKYFVKNIGKLTTENSDYRRVIHTTHYTQLVLMSLPPGTEIGNEIHGLDQFIRVESGKAKVVLNNGENEYELKDDWAIIIPAGTYHNVTNTGDVELKLYTLYSPPNHLKDTIQPTKADEVEDKFDGKTTA
ncbi:cupin domain-containing protein [Candidatus Saccharibacteria bacterium]|nr:MAG: cupin domain-containing protein [Candidatus Saccharibacteria bacterium]